VTGVRVVKWIAFGVAALLAVLAIRTLLVVWSFRSFFTHGEPRLSADEQAKSDAADLHVERGKELLKQGRCAEALAEFDEADRQWPDATWFADRGECLSLLGRSDEAIALAEADMKREDPNHWTYGFDWGARWVERARGLDAAVAWFRDHGKEYFSDLRLESRLAEWHHGEGRAAAAIPLFVHVVETRSAAKGLRFDESGHVVASGASDHDYAAVWPDAGQLARACADAGHDAEAIRYGTLAIEAAQRSDDRSWEPRPGYFDAGDVDGRIARATAFMRLGRFDEAGADLRAADVLASWGYEMYKPELEALHAELARRRDSASVPPSNGR
jgi:tetratricopeptide (TPR) repeat protein